MADATNEPATGEEQQQPLTAAEQKKRDKATADAIEQAEKDAITAQEDADKAIAEANATAAAAESTRVQASNQAVSDQQMQIDPARQVQMWPPADLGRDSIVPEQQFKVVQQRPGLVVAEGLKAEERKE